MAASIQRQKEYVRLNFGVHGELAYNIPPYALSIIRHPEHLQ